MGCWLLFFSLFQVEIRSKRKRRSAVEAGADQCADGWRWKEGRRSSSQCRALQEAGYHRMDAAAAEAEEELLEKICTGDFVAETANDEWGQRPTRAAS